MAKAKAKAVQEKTAKTKPELTNAAKREKGIDQIGYLGGKLVVSITKRTINEKEYNNVVLADGAGYLLSDKDLDAQLKKKK